MVTMNEMGLNDFEMTAFSKIIPNLPNVLRRPQQMFNNALILSSFTAVSVFDELMCELFSSWGFHFS